MKKTTRYNKGFTLAEAMLAMVVLSIATAAVILPFSTGAAMNTEGMHRTLGAKLGADLLEEIANTNFSFIPSWYDNYYEGPGSMRDAEWNVFTDDVYSKFARLSRCSTANVGGETLIWVTVHVYYDSQELLSMSRLVGPG